MSGGQLIFRESIGATPEVCQAAVEIQREYGSYMFDELGLVEGKEGFYGSLENFPGLMYQRPSGCYFVAYNSENVAVGAVGIRKFTDNSCEMKRIFVRPQHRMHGYGDVLVKFVIDEAKQMGYKTMFLDSDEAMQSAIRIYVRHGFQQIEAYCINVNPGAVYYKLELQ